MSERTAGGRLQLIALAKRYDQTSVLEGIDLAVEDGEFLTILGPSGSGKTTILRLIGGFTEPSAGQILFDGSDIAQVPIHRRPFNTVFQDYALFPHMTVGQNVGYGLMVRGVARAGSGRGSPMRSRWWRSRTSASAIRTSSRAASASAWRSPGR